MKDINKDILSKQQEEKNRAKYGAKSDDVISRAYRESKFGGDFYCYKNVEKYLRRYCSQSEKGGNIIDLQKSMDYLQRMIDMNTTTDPKEVIEK